MLTVLLRQKCSLRAENKKPQMQQTSPAITSQKNAVHMTLAATARKSRPRQNEARRVNPAIRNSFGNSVPSLRRGIPEGIPAKKGLKEFLLGIVLRNIAGAGIPEGIPEG